MKTRESLVKTARAHGITMHRIVNTAIYGTRHQPDVNASQAWSKQSAIGHARISTPSSVWNGPAKAARPGEPVLRRAKLA